VDNLFDPRKGTSRLLTVRKVAISYIFRPLTADR
jgi:hypothetical protein